MRPTHGYRLPQPLRIASVRAKARHHSECPVWTGVQGGDFPTQELVIRKHLAAADLGPRSLKTARWANGMAGEFYPELTLDHATPGTEIYAPGGRSVQSEMREELDASATKRRAKFQQDSGIPAPRMGVPRRRILGAHELKKLNTQFAGRSDQLWCAAQICGAARISAGSSICDRCSGDPPRV